MNEQPQPNPKAALAPETLATTPTSPLDPFATRTSAPPENSLRLNEEFVAVHWSENLPTTLPTRLGRYLLNQRLGKGGMGAVYLAHDTQLDRPVAIKLPCFGANPRPDEVERFLREARAAAVLSHPNLCPVYDVGQIEGISYITMAYIEGQPLSEVLYADQSLSIPDAVRLIHQLALAMEEAHQHGVIHRDLKPSNIMIDLRRQPIIMDFGLARRGPETGDVRLTQSGMIVGTPAYMSPEQVKGNLGAMGPLCDLYSLGVILYEMLSGRLPFLGTVGELMAQIVTVSPPPPSQFRPGLDPQLEAICLKSLAKNPVDRYATMHDFASMLDSYLHNASERIPVNEESGVLTGPYSAKKVGAFIPQTQEDEVSRLYLAARYFLGKRTEESNRKSIATYYQLLDKDPTYALAWAGLAFAYHLLGVRGHASPNSASPKGKCAALQALDLDPSLAEAHTALAVILLDYEWDFAGAERAFQRALELNPTHAVAHQLYGKCLACMGRPTEAIAAIRHAQELHPLSTIFGATLGRHGYFYAQMYEQAVREFRKTIETDPTFWIAHHFLGWAYVFQGKLSDALVSFTTASQFDNNPEIGASLGYVYAVSSQTEKALESLHVLTELGRHRHVAPINHAIVHIGLGDKDQAFFWLDKAVEEHAEWMCKIHVDPVFDSLRSHPRFLNLLQRITDNTHKKD